MGSSNRFIRVTPSSKVRHLLGIETSCDECSAAVVRATLPEPEEAATVRQPSLEVLGMATYSQIAIHRPYGGVVPEIASRNHLETIHPMIDRAMNESGLTFEDIHAIAVTNRPGLVGALLVGVTAAKSLAYARRLPLVPVHHLEGHVCSLFLDSPQGLESLQYPLLLAVISGGHTNLHVVQEPPTQWSEDFLKKSLVGRSRDDAAGEAFDKTAKLLGFPYPGGVHIDQASEKGNPKAFDLPRALPQKNTLDYSFSGLKTAVALATRALQEKGELEKRKADLCASIQEAIVDAILAKMWLAIRQHGCRSLAIVGGVAANRRLRQRLETESPVPCLFPKREYCTDNAAMIAAAGTFRFLQGKFLDRQSLLTLNAHAGAET